MLSFLVQRHVTQRTPRSDSSSLTPHPRKLPAPSPSKYSCYYYDHRWEIDLLPVSILPDSLERLTDDMGVLVGRKHLQNRRNAGAPNPLEKGRFRASVDPW